MSLPTGDLPSQSLRPEGAYPFPDIASPNFDINRPFTDAHDTPPSPLTPSPDSLTSDQTDTAAHLTRRVSARVAERLESGGSSAHDADSGMSEDAPPATPTKSKGKAKQALTPKSTLGTDDLTAPKTATSGKLPTGKAETAAAGIKRIDAGMSALVARIGALAARVEKGTPEIAETVATLQSRLTDLAQSMASPTPSPSVVNLETAVSRLIASANGTTKGMDTLHAENNANAAALASAEAHIRRLEDQVATMQATIDKLLAGNLRVAHPAADARDLGLPPAKRPRTVSNGDDHTLGPAWTVNRSDSAPQSYTSYTRTSHTRAPAHLPAYQSMEIPRAPDVLPTPIPSGSQQSSTSAAAATVEIGPLLWSRDITGQVKALIALVLPGGNSINFKGFRAIRTANNLFVNACFVSNRDANLFVNAWNANPPSQYTSTSVRFAGNE